MLTILLVEDNDTHAHLVTRGLAKASTENEVIRVVDGVQALAAVRCEGEFSNQPRPDIVLLDLKLPKVDGLKVLRAIKSDAELCHLPVIIMTTSNAKSDRDKAYSAHANSYLVKPLDFVDLRNMLDDLCRFWGRWNAVPDSRRSSTREAR